ncbi:proton-conducting transporter membrane subunit [Bradyrhizobium sp. Ai1a-2]|uniref:proton-conducting transporter transmembrane domain-containing protein n=1 Tax=Bradyrhizobium sp. Ai1a-2 TaxID=196490 RepID=UPI000413B466|nr:proton-conducting transporter membrane subunit [Bradyrhizobium sp. Ai1a-2]
MVESLLHPLNIFIVGLGGGFLIPLFYRLGKSWVAAAFVLALAAMTLISGYALFVLLNGAAPIEILTGGAKPPYAINLRMGLAESIFAFSINLVALFGAAYVVRERYGTLLLYLLLVMGIQGMVMTRDLFNLFVFLEIVSIATYALLGLRDTPAALSATFKFLMATVLASTFFLIGTLLLYAATGILNIDELIAKRGSITGPIGFAALIFLLACLLLELKPFPANGWGLDVYETARSDVAAMISGGVSAGVLFALLKLLPLFEDQLELIAALGAITFVFSNLIGLQQTKAQRLLGYSSIGQMALLTIAAPLLYRLRADDAMRLVVGGLFINHLFAKVGLFWLAGYVSKERLQDWAVLARRPGAILVFGILIIAISGLPPFPGFWAKWQLIMTLAVGNLYVWIAIVLMGSLLEAAYMFRWFSLALHSPAEADAAPQSQADLFPIFGMALLLVVSGYVAGELAGLAAPWSYMPLVAGLVLYMLAGLPSRMQCLIMLVLVSVGGTWLVVSLSGINFLFATLLLAGGLVVSSACLARTDPRPGFYPLLAVMLLSLPALPRATTSLEFIFIWELITLSSYFLILRRTEAASHALQYLLFSLAAAFFLLCAFAVLQAQTDSVSLSALRVAGPDSAPVFVLLAIGLLIKAGSLGVHVWLPGAYAEADDDVSALLSAVISKVSIFGLLVGTYVAILSEVSLNLALVMGWIGMLTTLAGAMLAARQDDLKRMLAYSSMSQLGYIVAAIALMSHLGWVTALYLVANHLLVKGTLFLVAAAIILRTGTRLIVELGGLAGVMPVTFATAATAIVAMSGLPPLAGFGGKWLLLSAMMEKGWYGPAVMTLLATFVGFVYMARFIRAIFLGPRKAAHDDLREAPITLLIPQILLIAGIFLMSFFPKLLIAPISEAIDPQFASTLVWQGMSLEMIYGYWNPVPVMAFAVIVSAILLGLFWLLLRSGWWAAIAHVKIGGTQSTLYEGLKTVFTMLTPPWAGALWGGLATATTASAERIRRLYTGNGQTYNLYILYYFLVLYVAGGGVRHLWPAGQLN